MNTRNGAGTLSPLVLRLERFSLLKFGIPIGILGDIMEFKKLNWTKLGLIFALLLIFVATPSFAYSGSLTGTSFLNVTTHTSTVTGSVGAPEILQRIYFPAIQNYPDIMYVSNIIPWDKMIWDFSVQGGSIPVDFYIGPTIIGNGTFSFNNNSATGNVNILVTMSSWNIGGRSGVYFVNMTTPTDPTMIHGLKDLQEEFVGAYGGNIGFGPTFTHHMTSLINGYGIEGDYTVFRQYSFRNDWTLTQSGTLIAATVNKTISGKSYQSKVGIYQTDNTLISGEAIISITDFVAYTISVPIKIAIVDQFNIWYNTSYYFSGASYILSVNPANSTPIQNVTGTIFPALGLTLNSITQIGWQYAEADGTGVMNLYENSNESRPMYYSKIGSFWYGYDLIAYEFTNNKTATMPNPVIFKVPTSGAKLILCTLYDSTGNVYYLTAPLTVSSGYITSRAVATDSQTGNLIYGANINFKDVTNGTWTNTTTTTANGGIASIVTPAGHILNIYANATGYSSKSVFGVPVSDVIIYSLVLNPLNVTAAHGNTTLYVNVQDDAAYTGIQGATVKVRSVLDQSFFQMATTPISGTVSFFIPNNTEYWVSTEAWGYQGVSQGISIIAEPSYSLNVKLHRIPVTAQPTPFTVAPTPTATIPGYQPATGNFTGFWAPFLNMGVAMGADPSEVGLLMALFLALAGLFVGGMGPAMAAGSMGFNPIGGEIGAVLGVAASVAFGFFPFAIAIIVVVALVLYVSLRFWGAAH